MPLWKRSSAEEKQRLRQEQQVAEASRQSLEAGGLPIKAIQRLNEEMEKGHPLFTSDLSAKAGQDYQAVSGTGAKAIEELKRQVDEIVSGKPVTKEVYPHQIAFNVLPHVDSFLETGYTKEETKMQNEARKIMHLPQFCASVTCVRVPVYRAHSVAVSAEFERTVSLERAREVLAKAPGLELVDEPQNNRYPMPLSVTGKDNCQVGRVRLDCAFENGLSFWVSGDQLLKGAALNAVQIAELFV